MDEHDNSTNRFSSGRVTCGSSFDHRDEKKHYYCICGLIKTKHTALQPPSFLFSSGIHLSCILLRVSIRRNEHKAVMKEETENMMYIPSTHPHMVRDTSSYQHKGKLIETDRHSHIETVDLKGI